ncbi:hypothetical protein Esti_006551 [Eimeria stiedai]
MAALAAAAAAPLAATLAAAGARASPIWTTAANAAYSTARPAPTCSRLHHASPACPRCARCSSSSNSSSSSKNNSSSSNSSSVSLCVPRRASLGDSSSIGGVLTLRGGVVSVLSPQTWSQGLRTLGSSSSSSSRMAIWQQLQQQRFSNHPLKLKSRDIQHPHVPAPEHLPPARYTEARLEGLQEFIPSNFYRELRVDAAREGVFVGFDGPLSFNGKWASWRRRKYNTVSFNTTPVLSSNAKGVQFLPRLNVFAVQWQEDGVHRIRWFRAAYGIQRAKRAAERFRRTLEAVGRVDGEQSERQIRQKAAARRKELRLRRRLFGKLSSGQF